MSYYLKFKQFYLVNPLATPLFYCYVDVASSSHVGFGTTRLYRNGYTLSSNYYGIVQIYINGQWGNICDDNYYSQYEADIICHQLGYTGASSYSRAGLVRLVSLKMSFKT